MTNSVNKVPLSSVEETTSDKSKEIDEFDVVNDFDSNYILEGAEELEQIEFNVLVNEISHPENLDVDSQVKEIKSLSKKDISENSFSINGKRGFISVENISIPEEGNVSNLREVTVSGKFLPWPKHFPNILPINYIFLSEKTSYRHFLNAIPNVLVGVDGGIDGSFLLLGEGDVYGEGYSNLYGGLNRIRLSRITSLNKDVSLIFNISSTLSLFTSLSSSSKYILNSEGNVSIIFSLDGETFYSLDVFSSISNLKTVSSDLFFNLNTFSDLILIIPIIVDLSFENDLIGDIKKLVTLSSNINTNFNLFGELSVGYGSSYGSNYSN